MTTPTPPTPPPLASPTVQFVNVQAQPAIIPMAAAPAPPVAPPSPSLTNNLQQLLNALSVLSSSTSQATTTETNPAPPVAHQTYNAEAICTGHQAGRQGIYRDRTNCSIFYVCEGNDQRTLRYHIFFCPPGLQFSMDGCTCDWPNGRSCQTSGETLCVAHTPPTPVTTTTTTPPMISGSGQMPQSAMVALNGLGQLLGVSRGASPVFDCAGRRSGLYRDMYDCTKFYFCTSNNQPADGTLLRYDFVCPANYAFSMSTCRCELGQSHTCHTLTKTDCLLL